MTDTQVSWWSWRRVTVLAMAFVLPGLIAAPARSEVAGDGTKVGQWKTWVLVSGREIHVPAPPADTSDQTKAELAELRQLQKERSPSTNTAIQYYNAAPATQRWHDLAHALARAEKQSLNRQARRAAILHTALHDAVIATWAAKYQFNASPESMAVSTTPVTSGPGTRWAKASVPWRSSVISSTGSTPMKASRCEGARHASGVGFRTQSWGDL